MAPPPSVDEELAALLAPGTLVRRVADFSLASTPADSAHDFSHCMRVLRNALALARRTDESAGSEGAADPVDRTVLACAAFLHDIGNLPKSHPDSRFSSDRSAAVTVALFGADAATITRGAPERESAPPHVLNMAGDATVEKGKFAGVLDTRQLELLHDAILCHSFSRGLAPATREGGVFQDADRLDAIGAIGIARVFACTGAMGRSMHHLLDPFGDTGRTRNDKEYAVDHFFIKLLTLRDTMTTPAGKEEGARRHAILETFLADLRIEIGGAAAIEGFGSSA
jgi:uncharacterized protein